MRLSINIHWSLREIAFKHINNRFIKFSLLISLTFTMSDIIVYESLLSTILQSES